MKIVQLIGTCPMNIGKTPALAEGVERWCCNDPRTYVRIGFPQALKTWTRWFNVHRPAHIEKRHPNFTRWAREQYLPIYTLEADATIPGNVIFPGLQLIARFDDNFFTHQAAWLVALAMAEGFERIELWGYQFGAGTMRTALTEHKYAFERPCITYWLARAKQMGIEVVAPPEAKLFAKKFIYGYEGPALQ